ncbi:hypothetical protein HK405_004607 [Cladochytrium tenue]|nr:hypothetical protein HK405_004607 [Cladochytrium tenue]
MQLLIAAVSNRGRGNWAAIAAGVPNRTDIQCRERYENVLNPDLQKGAFTDQELAQLTSLVEVHGTRASALDSSFSDLGCTNLYDVFEAWGFSLAITTSGTDAYCGCTFDVTDIGSATANATCPSGSDSVTAIVIDNPPASLPGFPEVLIQLRYGIEPEGLTNLTSLSLTNNALYGSTGLSNADALPNFVSLL